MNEPIGRLGSFEPGAGAPHGLGDGVDGLLLADDALVQRVLHVQQALGLLLGDARHGDARPHGHDLGDVLLGDDRACTGLLGLPVAAQLVRWCARSGLRVAQLLGALVLLVVDRRLLLLGDRARAPSGPRLSSGGAELWRRRTRLDASSMRSMALSGRWRSVM